MTYSHDDVNTIGCYLGKSQNTLLFAWNMQLLTRHLTNGIQTSFKLMLTL
jgi:hypothetical protein